MKIERMHTTVWTARLSEVDIKEAVAKQFMIHAALPPGMEVRVDLGDDVFIHEARVTASLSTPVEEP